MKRKRKLLPRVPLKSMKLLGKSTVPDTYVYEVLRRLPMDREGIMKCPKCGGVINWWRRQERAYAECETKGCLVVRK